LRTPKLSYANVVSTLCLFLLLGGGAAIAADRLPGNSVGSAQIRDGAVRSSKIHGLAVGARKLAPHSVRAGKIAPGAVGARQLRNGSIGTAQIRDGSITGAKVDESTLDVVPVAQEAHELLPSEDWHVVGQPGEPKFQGQWLSIQEVEGWAGAPEPGPAFYKDRLGIVHLRGLAVGKDESFPGGVVFELPPGFRPANGIALTFPAFCESAGGVTEGNCEAVGVYGGGQIESPDGPVPAGSILTEGAVGEIYLSGISFRAES